MLSEKAIKGLISATPEKRYKSFLNTVTDTETVWVGSPKSQDYTTGEDGFSYIPLWPQQEFVISYVETHYPIEIHDFVEKCIELDDTTRFSVFPTENNTYIVTAKKLCQDIIKHLEELE